MSEVLKKKNVKLQPHLALTHVDQGGPANGRAVSLLMKNVDQLDPDVAEALTEFLKSSDPQDEVVKAASYTALYRKLEVAVKAESLKRDPYGWSYLRDFDDGIVVYSDYKGVWAAEYTESNGEITLGESTSVNEMISWEDSSGNLVLTQSENISTKVGSLVVKSFEKVQGDDEKLKDVFKSINKEIQEMNETQVKLDAAEAQIATLKQELEKATATAAATQAALDALNQAAAVQKSAARKEMLKAVVADGQLEALAKSLDVLDDDAFANVLETMTVQKSAADAQSGLFKQVSKAAAPGASAPAPQANAGLRAHLEKMNGTAQAHA